MSVKTMDKKNRWRSKTVAFRMSPEEALQLDNYAKLSGLSKQDYLINRVLQIDIIVNGNPRTYKMLRNQLFDVLEQLKRLESVSIEQSELLELISYITTILDGFSGGAYER